VEETYEQRQIVEIRELWAKARPEYKETLRQQYKAAVRANREKMGV